MAGFALTSPGNTVLPDKIMGSFTVANGEIINNGDPVGINASGYVVCASKTSGAIVKCVGFAVLIDDLAGGTIANVTGNVVAQPNQPNVVGICRHCYIKGVNSTLVPGLAIGAPVYLGAVASSGTVSAYTCTLTTTAGDSIEELGFVMPNGVDLWLEAPVFNGFRYQLTATSTVNFV